MLPHDFPTTREHGETANPLERCTMADDDDGDSTPNEADVDDVSSDDYGAESNADSPAS